MFHRSPILSFAIELFIYTLEIQSERRARERKLAVLHLAQVAELAVKAALVERNIRIYEKGGRTINTHDAQDALATAWGRGLPMRARVEILIDERNGIQHRYGNIDDVTLDYHLETATEFLRELLKEDFDIDLDALVRDTVSPGVWRAVRFIRSGEPAPEPSEPVGEAVSPVLTLLGGFANFERRLRERLNQLKIDTDIRSVLDVTMKFLGNLPDPDAVLLGKVPQVFTLRNATAHGVGTEPTAEDVREALVTLDRVVALLERAESETVLLRAVAAHRQRRAGIAAAGAPANSVPEQAIGSGGEPPAEA